MLATVMSGPYVLTGYMDRAMDGAVYDKLADGSFAGRIPACRGVVSFGATLKECVEELRSTLEDWLLLGIKLGHPLPVIAGLDLNQEPIVAHPTVTATCFAPDPTTRLSECALSDNFIPSSGVTGWRARFWPGGRRQLQPHGSGPAPEAV